MTELFYPAMGALALGVLWLNTLLIAAAALKQRGLLGVRLATLAAARTSGALRVGRAVSGKGPDGALVTRTIHQVGRAMTTGGPLRILFTQSKVEVEVHGGELELNGEKVGLAPAPNLEIWLAPDAKTVRSLDDFEAAHRQASTSRGLPTTSHQAIRVGDPVYYLPGVVLSTIDPEQALKRRRWGLSSFAVLSILFAGAITAVVFVPPVFGTISTIGGALGLLYFVLVQPAGVNVRNWARLPHEKPHVDTWAGGPRPN